MDIDIEKIISRHEETVTLLRKNTGKIKKIASLCQDALNRGKKIIFFGNGGSAADAQHLAAEFVGRFQKNRRPLAALALTVNTSTLTAVANDFGFEQIFLRQISALGSFGDIAIGISTSGNSMNVIKAFGEAKRLGLSTIAFLGSDGGQAAGCADLSLIISSAQTPIIQEVHIMAGHIICEIIENSL